MYQEEMKQRFNKIRRKLWMNIVINWFIPLVVVFLISTIYHNDTIALAAAGVIPLVRTAAIFMWRNCVDWIGILGALGFATAFAISALSGGSSLPLKLYHPVVTGIIGVIFLISVIIRKPLLVTVLRALKYGDSARFNSKVSYKKFTMLTTFLGLMFTIDALIHIIMAITLSTVTFMAVSKGITLVMVLILIIGRRWIVRKNNKD